MATTIFPRGPLGALSDGTPFPTSADVTITSDSPTESPVLLRIELESGQPVLAAITLFHLPGTNRGSSALRDAPVRKLTDQAVSSLVEHGLIRDLLDRGER